MWTQVEWAPWVRLRPALQRERGGWRGLQQRAALAAGRELGPGEVTRTSGFLHRADHPTVRPSRPRAPTGEACGVSRGAPTWW